MQSRNRLLDDIAKVANTAISSLAGVKDELEAIARHQLERYLSNLNLVEREEFEVIKAMVEKTRLQNLELNKKIESLEKKIKKRPPLNKKIK